MILTESRSLAGVLRAHRERVSRPHCLDQRSSRRFSAHRCCTAATAGDTVLYLGDYDLSGEQIEANTRRVLEREIGGGLNWERLALTEQQVRDYDLPRIVKHDRRYKDGRPHEAVENRSHQPARAD